MSAAGTRAVAASSEWRPARLGITVALLWPLGELVVRAPGIIIGEANGSAAAGDAVASLAGFPALAGAATFLAARHGQAPAAMALHGGTRRLTGGAALGLVVLAVALAVHPLDVALFGASPSAAGETLGASVIVLVVLSNGIVAPVAEEVAWRGVVQTALVGAWGATVGVLVTAGAFSFKHVLVDASPGRLLMLFAFGLGLGVIRSRAGTLASAAAHVAANLAATAAFLVETG